MSEAKYSRIGNNIQEPAAAMSGAMLLGLQRSHMATSHILLIILVIMGWDEIRPNENRTDIPRVYNP